MPRASGSGHGEQLSLSQAAEYLLEECRMVLPGMQALFGFQLIAVFSARYPELLSPAGERLHLLAIGLVAVAIALVMTPAAYHRQSGSKEISEKFIRLSSRLLLGSMPLLALGICLDFYLIARVVIADRLGVLAALALFGVFLLCWFALPRVRLLERLFAGK